MRFLGKVHSKKPGEKYHSVVVPELGIYTQGKDFEDCLEMVKDALKQLLEVEVEVSAIGKTSFSVTSKDLKPLVGRFLETMRENSKMTIRELTAKLGKTSPNYYAQYERGESLPSMELISAFVKAMDPKSDVVISVKKVV